MSSLPRELRATYERYIVGPSLVRQAIDGCDARSLNAPGPDGWSARNIVVHLADAELAAGFALRAVLAGSEDLAIPALDGDRWRRGLSYLWRDAEAALSLFQQLRFSNAELLQHADREALARSGRRDGAAITPARLLEEGVLHVDEHVGQLHAVLGRGQGPA